MPTQEGPVYIPRVKRLAKEARPKPTRKWLASSWFSLHVSSATPQPARLGQEPLPRGVAIRLPRAHPLQAVPQPLDRRPVQRRAGLPLEHHAASLGKTKSWMRQDYLAALQEGRLLKVILGSPAKVPASCRSLEFGGCGPPVALRAQLATQQSSDRLFHTQSMRERSAS
jgi:hypothetical protein